MISEVTQIAVPQQAHHAPKTIKAPQQAKPAPQQALKASKKIEAPQQAKQAP